MPTVPRCSYGRGLLRKDGAPNRNFLTYLFGHQEPAITHHVTAVTTHKHSSSLGLGRNIFFYLPAITHHVTAVITHKYSSSLCLGRNNLFSPQFTHHVTVVTIHPSICIYEVNLGSNSQGGVGRGFKRKNLTSNIEIFSF
jgi:hypothetical protein